MLMVILVAVAVRTPVRVRVMPQQCTPQFPSLWTSMVLCGSPVCFFFALLLFYLSFYSDSYRVLRFDDVRNKQSGAPADGVLGQNSLTICNPASTTPSATTFYNPDQIVGDAEGGVYVAGIFLIPLKP
jgi:hypothetical protein